PPALLRCDRHTRRGLRDQPHAAVNDRVLDEPLVGEVRKAPPAPARFAERGHREQTLPARLSFRGRVRSAGEPAPEIGHVVPRVSVGSPLPRSGEGGPCEAWWRGTMRSMVEG